VPDDGLPAALAELDRLMRPEPASEFTGCAGHCVSMEHVERLGGPVELITPGAVASVLLNGPYYVEPWSSWPLPWARCAPG
jgi:hypothetical protein